jgi:hypothetical protein
VKRETKLQVPNAPEGCPTDVSAEAALYREIAKLGEWLEAQGLDLGGDDQAQAGSRDRLYWRYGYFMGLKQALALLTSRDATLH